MNDLIEDVRITGSVHFGGEDIYRKKARLTDLRKKIGWSSSGQTRFP